MWWETEGHLTVRQNQLFIGEFSAEELARRYGTPLFVYNGRRIEQNYQTLQAALNDAGLPDWKIHYAMKANPHPDVLETVKSLGAGIDATSPQEVRAAQNAGFPDREIVFTGTSLSNRDLADLAGSGVLINFDSLSALRRFPGDTGRKIGLRINSGVGIGRNAMMSTGGGSVKGLPVKFGINPAQLEEAAAIIREKGYRLHCLHHHVGSNWLGKNDKYFLALRNLLQTVRVLRQKSGAGIPLLDLGGGYGVPFGGDEKPFDAGGFFRTAAEIIRGSGLAFEAVKLEPGNFLLRDAGILLAEVNTVERKNRHTFAGVDAGLNVFNSAALYGYRHEIVACRCCQSAQTQKITVVGNICETGDIFGIGRELPPLREGDVLALLDVGAYAAVMGNNYNLRPRAEEVFLS